MHAIVLTNLAAGAKAAAARADQAGELRSALVQAGIDADVRQVDPEQLTAAAAQAAAQARRGAADAVIAAGGDGTVSAVAAALVGSDVPLGIIPTGTLNHFARDLALPPALAPAVKVLAAGHVRRIDVGNVNGHVFLNNASIGLYPHIVGKRDSARARLGRNKWVATLMAALSVFRRYPSVRVRIGVGDQTVLRTTPFVFVGNNRYEINLTMLGRRQRLDGGELCVYVANRAGRWGLLRLALRALLGRLEQAKDFDALNVTELWIETPKKRLRVALDGEIVRLAPPLHYCIRPAALAVLAPPPAEASAATAAGQERRGPEIALPRAVGPA